MRELIILIFSFLLVVIFFLLELWKRISINKYFLMAFLFILPHTATIYYLINKTDEREPYQLVMNTISFMLLLLIGLYSWLRLNIFPVKITEPVSYRVRAVFGGRTLIFCSLYMGSVYLISNLFLNGLFVFLGIPLTIITFSYIFAICIFATLLLNGYLRILLLSRRLKIPLKIIVSILIFVPFVNLVVLFYLTKTAYWELDNAINKISLRQQEFSSDSCKTKYPIVLLHGIGFRDFKYVNYWGRIPKELMRNGAEIYYGNQEAIGTIQLNALEVTNRINRILETTEHKKVNIVAHSKGGLDARYAITKYGLGDKVASLTMISTPNRGCKFVDLLIKVLPNWLYKFICKMVDAYFRSVGDVSPDLYHVSRQFSTKYNTAFNEEVKDDARVYYQSYISAMRGAFSDFVFCPTYIITKILEGENDGIVSTQSTKWGDFRGVIKNTRHRGISHGDIIDFKRDDYDNFDVIKQYIEIIKDIKEKGF